MSADGSADEAAIEVLVAEALRQREEDGTVDLAKVCAGRPELLDAVAAALADAPRLAAMHAGALALDRRIGEQLQGRYVVDRRIGAGAMGVVYEARDTTLARTVAIKLLRQDLASDPHSEERFLREAQVLASIRHPAVVTLFDRGRTDDGAAFLVMERLNGHTAAALLQQGAAARAAGAGSPTAVWRELLGGAALDDSDVRQAVRWLADAAAGLQAAHEAGVVHRDVKPSNLFIDRDGRAVLLDFGIGSLGAGSTALTATGSTLGTPAYMAPEQLNAADVGPATDVYGLGATLYHFLTGEPPFSGTPQQILAALDRREPVRADKLRPGLPRDLLAVLERAMAPEPARRYRSAAALRADLLAWLDYRPVSARRTSAIGRVARACRRSTAFRAAAATLAIIAALTLWSQYSDARVHDRLAAATEHLRHVPPSLVVALLATRGTNAVTSSPATAALLDTLVELADEPCPAHALRAVLELDRGDLGAAAADLAAVAATGTAPFSRWLAAELAEGRQPTFAAPNDAPTPDNSADRYVAALFWLRSERVPEREIAELLGTIPDLDRRPGFAELQLAALMIAYDPAQDGDVVAFRQRLNARAAAIDALRGGMSAMTAQVRLNALLGLELYAEARDLAEQAIALAPEDFILHKLRAETEFFRGRYEAALAPLRQTLALQPRSRKTHELLVLAELYSGDVAAAEHTLTHPGLPMAPARLAFFEGLVLHEKAFRALAGETALGDASELAAAAADAFARSRDEAAPVSIDELACRALIDPSPDIVTGLLRAAADSALDPRRLQQLSNLLGEQLDQDQTAALVDLLRRQARQLRTTAH